MKQSDLNFLHSTIAKIAYTQEEALRILRFMREYLEEYFFSKPDLTIESFLSSHTISERDKELLSSLGQIFFVNFTRVNFYQILKDLRIQIEKDPIVTVYVPVGIDEENTKKLALWFKENLSPSALMDLKVDDKLVAGISFVWNGIKHEYSFKMLFDRKKEEILKMVEKIGNKNKSI